MRANHKEAWVQVKTGRGVTEVHVLPGQFIFGRKSASLQLKMKESTIRNRIEKLKKMGNMDIQPDTHYSIITIINWELYQGENNKEDRQEDRQRTGKGQAKDTNKNEENVKNEENKKNKDFLSDSTEYGLSELLFDEILKNNPNQKKPNLQTWAKDIDRMIRLDNRNPDDIRKIIVWAQGDTFWKSNILSAVKLRQHFDKLYLKMTGGKKGDKYDF